MDLPNILYAKSVDENNKLGMWANFQSEQFTIRLTKEEVEVSNLNGEVYLKGFAPIKPEPTIHEKALLVQMSKREFVKIVSYVTSQTAGMTPITLTLIESYVASQGDDLRNEWINCTYIERANPMLDEVAKDPTFGISSDLLDIMFANWQELLYLADNNLPLEG